MGVYIKGLSIEQVKALLYIAGGDGLGEAFDTYLVEVSEPHGRLMDLDAWLKNNGMSDDCKYCADRNNRISLYEKNYSKCDICNIVDDERTIVVVEAEGE